MKNISDEVLSVEEARAALRCMRLSRLDEAEAIESIDSFVNRIRKVGTAKLVGDIINNHLSSTQRKFVTEYWYHNKNTSQIARENGVSQANVYRTIARANETIKNLLTPLIMYQRDLPKISIKPLYVEELLRISSAQRCADRALPDLLSSIRQAYAVTPEEMSRVMCITVKELEAIEKGKKEVTFDLLSRYSKIFGIEIEMKIINGKGRYIWKEVLHS